MRSYKEFARDALNKEQPILDKAIASFLKTYGCNTKCGPKEIKEMIKKDDKIAEYFGRRMEMQS